MEENLGSLLAFSVILPGRNGKDPHLASARCLGSPLAFAGLKGEGMANLKYLPGLRLLLSAFCFAGLPFSGPLVRENIDFGWVFIYMFHFWVAGIFSSKSGI